ncbi:hypothetical protein [Anaerotignum sp.]|uniref:hypothetical protein n=1 Tax=Anaerotignum sp. TaxID=2039241 RepID=UPI00332E3333
MDSQWKKMIAKVVVGFVVFVMFGYVLFNGLGRFPYDKGELEQQFLDRAKEVLLLGDEEYTLVSKEYANSVTFLLKTESDERACGTYVRNMFWQKYQESHFYSGKNGVLYQDTYSYRVNDHMLIYDMNFTFTDEPKIIPPKEVVPIMYYKYLGVCIVAMGFFGGRILANRKPIKGKNG